MSFKKLEKARIITEMAEYIDKLQEDLDYLRMECSWPVKEIDPYEQAYISSFIHIAECRLTLLKHSLEELA